LKGLTGISKRNNKIVRPLLCCTRTEIENYIVEHKLEHIEDSTNATLDYQRNKFRNAVLPHLEEINPSVRQTLYESLERFGGNFAIYQQAIENIQNQLVHKHSDSVQIDIELLNKQVHIPTVLFEILQPYGFHSDTIQQIAEQINQESGKTFYSETHRLLKDRKYLIISAKEDSDSTVYLISQDETKIHSPISMMISRKTVDNHFEISKMKNCIHVDASKLTFPLQIRRWCEGDSFFPFGMNQRKKISDFFIDNKLSRLEKEKTWLLLSGDEVVWIIGQRTDNRFKVTKFTNEVIELQVITE
jgi:tRNA(Ile)-lysidine synthase